MVRTFAFSGMIVILAVAWVIFEVANIWPINADRITTLRLMFGVGAVGSVAAFALGRSLLLPPALIAVGFVSTTVFSHAVMTAAYIAGAAVMVALVAVAGWTAPRPLYRS